MPSTAGYNTVAKCLHWLIAAGILFMLWLGWSLDDFQGSEKFQMFQLHKSIGITILLLVCVRLAWRLAYRPPELPANLKQYEVVLARLGHLALYILMVVMPMTGWAMVSSSVKDIPTILFGIIPWPHLPVLPDLDDETKKYYDHLFMKIHGLLALGIAGMVIIHFAAALKHHFVDRNNVLLRMTPNFMSGFLNRLRGMK